MFRNVVAALNEALDITMHLKPLTSHFEVNLTLTFDNDFSIYQSIQYLKTKTQTQISHFSFES